MQDLLDIMTTRKSIRRYKPDPVPDEMIDKVLEGARWASTGENYQPWRFIVVRDQETRNKIGDLARIGSGSRMTAWTRSSPTSRSAGRPRRASTRDRRRTSRSWCTGRNSARPRGCPVDKEKILNEMLYRMEELFYHELSDCASWKTELVGIDFIQSQDIRGTNEKEVIESCIGRIKAAGLARDIEYSISHEDILLKLRVRGCTFMLKETLLKKGGVRPYNCAIANMICDQLIEKLGYTTTYVADLHADEATDQCDIRTAIYATPEKIGAVSDWSKD